MLPVDGQIDGATNEAGEDQLLRVVIEQPGAAIATSDGRAGGNQFDPLRRLAVGGQHAGEVGIEGEKCLHDRQSRR